MRISVEGKSGGVRVRMRFEQFRRRLLIVRIMLAILAVQGAIVGLWAVFAPHSWYTSFPGFGMHWISVDGPYNHHLVGDVGAFFLALTAITIAALVINGTAVARLAGIGWLTFGLPHFIYHAFHKPAEMGAGSFTLSLLAAAVLVILGLGCVVIPPRGDIPMSDPAPMDIRFPRRRPR
ncbi:hypothetical protein [Nocardia sp. NBC_01009]|uniref:hypothetical protein n=1 Tax=Nocardia sp. NBC_01009 TaxID=2975996 RepID=UPI00386DC959|nr:hypothetical protein OHA42_12920 [Nocardia sp. NBC_01009]